MGFDSLFLTQVSQVLQSKVGLKITFRQLLGDQSTLDALAEYLESKLPADVLSEIAPAPSPVSAASEVTVVASGAPVPPMPDTSVASEHASASGSAVERLMRDQLRAMNQLFSKQLETLSGGVPSGPAISRPESADPEVCFLPGVVICASGSLGVVKRTNCSNGSNQGRNSKPFGPYKPPHKGTSGELTERHERNLKALIERYTTRTAKSKSMTQEYRFVLADPRVVAGFRSPWKEMVYPITTIRSKGSHLWDLDGNGTSIF